MHFKFGVGKATRPHPRRHPSHRAFLGPRRKSARYARTAPGEQPPRRVPQTACTTDPAVLHVRVLRSRSQTGFTTNAAQIEGTSSAASGLRSPVTVSLRLSRWETDRPPSARIRRFVGIDGIVGGRFVGGGASRGHSLRQRPCATAGGTLNGSGMCDGVAESDDGRRDVRECPDKG